MKTLILIAIGFVVVATVSGFFHHSGGHHEHQDHHEEHKDKKNFECKGEPIQKNHDLKVAKKECHHEFKQAKEDNVKDRQKGRACKSLCAGKKIGMFDEQGMIVESKVDELIESTIVSTEAQIEIKEKVANCANNNTELIGSGPTDNKCSNFKPYFKCIWLSAMEVCVPHFDPEDFE